MRILLDTQIALSAAIDDARLSPRARTLMLEASAAFVRAASVWEVSSKHALRRPQMRHSAAAYSALVVVV